MTSLAYIFTMEKALVKIIFGNTIFICQAIFKIFVALLTTFGMQKVKRSQFAGSVSEQGKSKKAVSKGWCKESNCQHACTNLLLILFELHHEKTCLRSYQPGQTNLSTTVKFLKFGTQEIFAVKLPKIQTKRPNLKGIMSKTCKWKSKQ